MKRMVFLAFAVIGVMLVCTSCAILPYNGPNGEICCGPAFVAPPIVVGPPLVIPFGWHHPHHYRHHPRYHGWYRHHRGWHHY